jgi:hypothetical protein
MPHRDAAAICQKIDAALDFMGEDENIRPYLKYQLTHIMGGDKRIELDDCTTAELTSLLAVVLPIFARKLAGALPYEGSERMGQLLTLIIGDGVDDDSSTGT